MTPQQLAVFDFVRDQVSEARLAPTYAEIVDRFGFASKAEVARTIDALVAAGWLVRTAAKQRNLALGDTNADLTRVGTGLLQAELQRRRQPFHRPRRFVDQSRSRPCAAAGCVTRVEPGHLFCDAHDRMLPQGLRRELIETFRAGQARNYADAYMRATEYLGATGGRA